MSTHFVILMFLLKLKTFMTLHKFILEIKQARDIWTNTYYFIFLLKAINRESST